MNTPNEKNIQSRLHLPDLNIDLHFYHEGPGILYQFFFKEKLLFSGNDYRPSPLYDPFSPHSMIDLLFWMTLAPGDTDKEHFDNYTPEQFAWCKTIERSDLSTYLYDYEGGSKKHQAEAAAYFKKGYTRYTHPDEIFTLYEAVTSKPDEAIYLTKAQKKNLLALFNRNKYVETTQKKLETAIADDLRKAKKARNMDAIIFDEDRVTFISKKAYGKELTAICRQLTYNY
jgi:hypothetical protein